MSSTQLLGASRQMAVAAALLEGGAQVFFPATDLGADLIACNHDFSKIVPVQVKYKAKDPSLKLDGKEIDKYRGRRLWLVFYVGQDVWSLPFDTWFERSEDPGRADRARYVGLNKNKYWLRQYQGLAPLLKSLGLQPNPPGHPTPSGAGAR